MVKVKRCAHSSHHGKLQEKETNVVCIPQRTLHRRRAGVLIMDWLLLGSKMENRTLHKGNKISKECKQRKLWAVLHGCVFALYIWGSRVEMRDESRGLKWSV